jgi:hypothetical protein
MVGLKYCSVDFKDVQSFCANLDVLPAHAKGLTTLVAMVGGLEALDHLMLSTIYQ